LFLHRLVLFECEQSNWTFESLAAVQKLASDWLKVSPEIAEMMGNSSSSGSQMNDILVS